MRRHCSSVSGGLSGSDSAAARRAASSSPVDLSMRARAHSRARARRRATSFNSFTVRISGSVSVWIFWHQFDLPKCQVHCGNAAVCLNVNFDGLFVYFLHFAPKTSERTIDDLYDAAFEPLMMFSHTTIRFSYGPRGPGFGRLASTISAKSVMPQRVWLRLAAIAGESPFSDLCCFT